MSRCLLRLRVDKQRKNTIQHDNDKVHTAMHRQNIAANDRNHLTRNAPEAKLAEEEEEEEETIYTLRCFVISNFVESLNSEIEIAVATNRWTANRVQNVLQ